MAAALELLGLAWLGSSAGILPTLPVLAALTFAGVLIARNLWQAIDADVIPHQHPKLPSSHPHLDGFTTGL